MKRAVRLWLPWVGLAGIVAVGLLSSPSAHAGSECSGKNKLQAGAECVSCDAAVLYQQRLGAASGIADVVPIRNGVMVLYTSLNPMRVEQVQAVALERWGVWDKIIAGMADGQLCAGCCYARQVMARADHHLYKTATGIAALVTATDPSLVREIQKMAFKRRGAPGTDPTAER